MITLPDRIKNDLSGNLTSAEYLVAIKTDPVIYISTTKQMFDATEGDVYGGNLISNGGFDDSTGWGFTAGQCTIADDGTGSNNVGKFLASGDYGHFAQNILTTGKTYKLILDCPANESEGIVKINQDPTNYTVVPEGETGTRFTTYFKATSTNTNLMIYATDHGSDYDQEISIDNVECYESSPTYYEDIDLKLSNIKEKIDLKTKKIQLSSMSLTFSNFPINEVRLSDKLGNGLGKEISVYLKTASCETLEDCIKVADLKINRYNHDRNTVKISADDKWLESFYIDLPKESNVLNKDVNTFENYHLKPVPILYGRLENAPAIPYKEYPGVLLLPDSSYFQTGEGSPEIGGIKYFNHYKEYDELYTPNVLKIKLGEDLCDVHCVRYVNSRSGTKHEYPQYETHNDNIKLILNWENLDTIFNRYGAFWCSSVKKVRLVSAIRYGYTYSVGNSYQYENWDEYGDSLWTEFDNIRSGHLPTGSNPSWSTGVAEYRFDDIPGIEILRPEENDPVYSVDPDYFEKISDIHFIGNAQIETTVNSIYANSLDYDILSFYDGVYTNQDLAETQNDGGGELGNGYSFQDTLDGRVWIDWFILRDNTRNHNRIPNSGNTNGVKYLSYHNAAFYSTDGSEQGNCFSSYFNNEGRIDASPTVNANTLSMYYTHEDQSQGSLGNQHKSIVDIRTEWSNDELFVRKIWVNPNVLEKDLFVNAQGRLGKPLVGAKGINGEMKVKYESLDYPSDFTSHKNRHFYTLFKILTNDEYRTKVVNGETYELMFVSYDEGGNRQYVFDIEVNNLHTSISLSDESNSFPINLANYINGEWVSHDYGWMFEIKAKIFGEGDNYGSPYEDYMYMAGLNLVYGKKIINNGVLEDIVYETQGGQTATFNSYNDGSWGSGIEQSVSGYTSIGWLNSEEEEDPRELLEKPENIISDLIESEMSAGGVQMPEPTNSRFGFSINEQKNSKDIIEHICSQSELFFRYSPRDGQAIIDKIKKQYTAGDVDKTIESDRILKYSFNKTKIDDLCFGGCRVKWGWDYGKEEALNITVDAVVDSTEDTGFMAQYLAEYGVEDSEKYQLEVEAPYINNEATAIKFRDFLFQFYKNTHLTLKLTLALQDGIELEVGDIVAFDKDIGGLKPYGRSIAETLGANGFAGHMLIDQQILPYFLITSVSKSLSKVDIEIMQMHNLTGTPIIYGCTDPNFLSYWVDGIPDGTPVGATHNDQSMCTDLIVTGCTNQNASNYMPDANVDDGTCEFSPDIPIADIQMTVESMGVTGLMHFYIDIGYNLQLSSSGSYDPDPTLDPEMQVNTNGISNVEWTAGGLPGSPLMPALQDYIASFNELGGALETLVIPITSEFFYEGQEVNFTLVVTDGMGNQSETIGTDPITIEVPVAQEDLGDITMDGDINVLDVVAMVNHIIGNHLLEGEALLRADVNQDDGVDVLDIVAIISIIINLPEDN